MVNICSSFKEILNALSALLHCIRRFAIKDVITDISPLAGEEERRVTMLVKTVNVQPLFVLLPFVDDPLDGSWIAKETCFMNGQVFIIIFR